MNPSLSVSIQNSTPPGLTHTPYRSDIDGLRAIAVLVVVGFHAFPTLLGGGFVGVDVFFVISGYLISRIIFENLERGSFSFIEFYSRRIRRIFPALILVLACCLLFGWFALLTDEYMQLGKHVAGGAAFISNFLFWNESGYFDNAAEAKPLLHLWSLGIEEQFYIAWPFLLWVSWKQKWNLLAVIAVLAAVSFALNIATVRIDPTAAFYSPQTRFWQLLAGSGLAYLTLHQPRGLNLLKDASLSVLAHIMSVVGIGMIVLSAILLNKAISFPGWWATLPTFGAVLIIAAGPNAWANRALLSNQRLVWVGWISYPLYLWHWPLLSFARIVEGGELSRPVRIALVLVSVALAWLTYRFVEQPIRSGVFTNTRRLKLSAAMVVLGAGGLVVFSNSGLALRYDQSPNDHAIREWSLKGDGVTVCGDFIKIRGLTGICATTNAPKVALVGDSHAGHLFQGFVNTDKAAFRGVTVMGAGSCQPTLGAESIKGCDVPLTKAIDAIEKTDSIEYVILSGHFNFIDTAESRSSEDYFRGYQRTFQQLRRLKKDVVFIIDNPTFKLSARLCEPRLLKLRELLANRPAFCTEASKKDLVPNTEYLKFVERLRRNNPDVYFYDSYAALCPGDRCSLFHESKLLYGDANHLSIYGSEFVVKDLIHQLENRSQSLKKKPLPA